MLLLAAMLCASLVSDAPALAVTTATTNDATNVQFHSAQLNGTVADADQAYFQWGTAPGTYDQQTANTAPSGNVSVTIGNPHGAPGALESNRTYYFRMVAIKAGTPVFGEEKTFTTQHHDPDGDGFFNDTGGDGCPDQAGIENGHPGRGCPPPPDGDGDGLPDYQDNCPSQSGPSSNGGCPPPPDTDGDGVADFQDNCPNEPGPPDSDTKPGCPADKDKDRDGIEEPDDKCPEQGHAYSSNDEGQNTDEILRKVRPAGHKYAGCLQITPGWYGLRAFPTMKDFLKKQQNTWGMICPGACKITQTISFDAATTKKLKLKTPVIDSMSDSAPCGASGQCTSGYMFNPGPNYEIPASIKKKLAKLKTVTILLTVNLTDSSSGATRGEKSKWGSKFVVGSKKKPAELKEL